MNRVSTLFFAALTLSACSAKVVFDGEGAGGSGGATGDGGATTTVSSTVNQASSTTDVGSSSVSSGTGGNIASLCALPTAMPPQGCVQCTNTSIEAGACQEQFVACGLDQSTGPCGEFASCLGECGGVEPCCNTCAEKFPEAAVLYDALVFCALCEVCFSECAGAFPGYCPGI